MSESSLRNCLQSKYFPHFADLKLQMGGWGGEGVGINIVCQKYEALSENFYLGAQELLA